MGHTRALPGEAPPPPAFAICDANGERPDGAVAVGGTVIGTYLHGLFDNAPVRRALLAWLAERKGLPPEALGAPPDPTQGADREFDRLAAALRDALDIKRLYRIIGL